MTVNSTAVVQAFSCNGSTTAFPFSIAAASASTIFGAVDFGDGTGPHVLTPGAYSVSLTPPTGGGTAAGGTFNFPLSGTPLQPGTTLYVYRSSPFTQPTSIRNQDGFYPDVLENALDDFVLQNQESSRIVANAIRANEFETSFNGVMPTAAQRANKLAGFDAFGNFQLYSSVQTQPDLTHLAVNGFDINPYGVWDQWCFTFVNLDGSGSGSQTIAFPLTFPFGCWNVITFVGIPFPARAQAGFAWEIVSLSTSGFTLVVGGGPPNQACGVYIRAVGS